MDYAIVIATMDRPGELAEALESLCRQTVTPSSVIIVDNSSGKDTQQIVGRFPQLPILYERATQPGAAHQRNQGLRHVSTPLVCFMDDDVVLSAETFANLLRPFEEDDGETIGGVSARFHGAAHPRPSRLLRLYYRIQSGYTDPTYGGRLFGAAVNTLPCYLPDEPEYISAEWLPSTCVLYRTACCQQIRFPGFEGYSFMEDVYLSASVGKTHRLLFSRDALCWHKDAPNSLKKDRYSMACQRYRNRARICREVLEMNGFSLTWRLLLQRLFDSHHILRQRQPGWFSELLGTWARC